MTSSGEAPSATATAGQQEAQQESSQLDVDTALQRLIERGYQFVHPTDANGALVAVVGVRVHDNVVDVVTLHAENDVQAVRMPGDEPDILLPQTVLWQVTGTAQYVLDRLLALPDDRTPGSLTSADGTDSDTDSDEDDSTVNGCWVPVAAGRSAWLPSSS